MNLPKRTFLRSPRSWRCLVPILGLTFWISAYSQPVLARLQPPTVDGHAVIVHVGLYSHNVGALDVSNDLFTESATLYMRWRDPRLAFKAKSPTEKRHYAPDQIWMPSYHIVNMINGHDVRYTGLVVKPDGTVFMEQNIVANLSWKYDYADFPFDTQRLDIAIRPSTTIADAVRFVPDDRSTGIYTGMYTQLPLWKITGISHHTQLHEVIDDGRSVKVQAVVFAIQAKRRALFYVWKLFVPLILIVCASWCLFWLKSTDISNQIHVAFASLLSIIAFGFAVHDDVPLVAQLSLFDKFYFLCFALIILQLAEVIVVHYLTGQERQAIGVHIHKLSRFAFPLIAVTLTAGVWLAA